MIFNPAHPGEVLRDYLGAMTVAEAATRLGVTRAHLSRILNGRAFRRRCRCGSRRRWAARLSSG